MRGIHDKGVQEYRIRVYEGSQWIKRFQWLYEDKDPIDITGYGARFMVKRKFGQSNNEAIVTLTQGNGIEVLDETGVFVITIPVSDTLNWPVRFGRWSLEIFPDPSNPELDVKLLIHGDFQYFSEVIV